MGDPAGRPYEGWVRSNAGASELARGRRPKVHVSPPGCGAHGDALPTNFLYAPCIEEAIGGAIKEQRACSFGRLSGIYERKLILRKILNHLVHMQDTIVI